MLERVLTEAETALLIEERALLGDLRAALARLPAPPEEQETFARSVEQLDQLFLLVVVGEFNAGKSAFINALLGQAVLEEGVTPTTVRVTLIGHGETAGRERAEDGLEKVTAPVDLLREVHIVDTPGTNAVVREHEALTRRFVPRSDLVLFVTSADRPFTESERAFLEAIRNWGKKVVVVVNKVDILETEAERAQVVAFVTENAHALLGVTPPIFAVSARQALRAKTGAAAAGDGGFPALEAHVRAILEERERVRLKLLNPLGVGARLAGDQLAVVGERLDLLKEDFETVDHLDRQLELYGQDLKRDFRFRLSDVDREILEFERRGVDFLDRTLRVSRIFDLVNRSRVELAFQREVLLDLPRQVERRVEEVIDWMVASDLGHWRGVMEQLDARRLRHADRMVGHVHGAFAHDRARLLEAARGKALRALEGYDHVAEAGRLGGQVRAAVAGTAFLQVSALGLGALVTALATTSLADATGLLAAGTLSVVGLLVLPARRSAAKRELRQKVEGLRTRVVAALDEEFTREADRSLVRIREAVAPYTRFVRGERERLDAVQEELRRIGDGLSRLRSRVEAL